MLLPQQEKPSSSKTTFSKASANTIIHTRFTIPEVLSRIISLLEPEDIYSACRVSCLFHSVCVQELWKVIHLDGCKAAAIWHGHEGFHMGLVRYGFFVEELRLARTYIGTEDMRIIAMNCTRLRVLDLTGTRVQAEALKVLLHSDPYANLPGSSEKRQQRTHTGGKVGKGVGRDRMGVHVEVDMEGKMWKYRRMVAAANGGYSGPYPSAAGPVSPFHVKPSSVSLTTESTTPGFRSATTSSTFTSNMLLLHQPITRLPLTHLSVVGTDVSDEGPVSLIRASRGTLSSIAAHATEFAYEFLFAFVEDRPTTEIQVGLPELHLEMSELELEQQTDCGPAKRTFTPNTNPLHDRSPNMTRTRHSKRVRNLPRPPVALGSTLPPALTTSPPPPAASSQPAQGTGLPASPSASKSSSSKSSATIESSAGNRAFPSAAAI
ncbi:MAG: hypothetical protein J3Q66DRAFT_407867 [Benniella sp.]|nr:MAG: hypothetical protein J3Q66DRAFT_407867 [Benniella sp.]